MNRTLRNICIFGIAAACSTVFGQATNGTTAAAAAPAQQNYSLQYAPKEGSIRNFKTIGDFQVMGTDATMRSTNKWTVLKVHKDGSYTVQSQGTSGTITFNGQQMDIPQTITSTTYASNGAVTKIEGDNIDGTSYRLADLVSIERPDKPVAVGDTWTETIPANATTGAVAVTGTMKVAGTEMVGARNTVKVDAVIRETEGTGGASIEATYWFDAVTGEMVQYKGSWSNVTVPGAPNPVSGTVTMQLVPDAKS